jgi:hypothetical protein
MCCVEGDTGSCSETCVTCDVDGAEQVHIKVEETIDIKDEIPDATIFPPIKTEQEVRFGGEVVAAHPFRPFIDQKGNSKVTLNCFLLLCYVVGAILCYVVSAIFC